LSAAGDPEAKKHAHKLILNADRTRYLNGAASKAVDDSLRAESNATTTDSKDKKKIADELDCVNVKDSGYVKAKPQDYALDNDEERNLLYLECRPKSSRAFQAIKWALGPKGVVKRAGYNSWSSLKYEPDTFSDVNTPTPADRREWIADMLHAEGIHYTDTPETHAEPDARNPPKVKQVYGRSGVLAADGTIQNGHYMRVGQRPSQVATPDSEGSTKAANPAEDPKRLYNEKTIFWIANQSPPRGSQSLWIPTATGQVVECWFSSADSTYQEEDRANDENRNPYMLASEMKKDRPWEIVSRPDLPTHDVPYDGYERPESGGGDDNSSLLPLMMMMPKQNQCAPCQQAAYSAGYSGYSGGYSGYYGYSNPGYSGYGSQYGY